MPTAVSAEQETKLTDFNALPYQLTIDENHGSVKIMENTIVIKANEGSDLFTSPSGNKSSSNIPMALFFPEGDFIFSAKVTATFSENAYEGGALVVYSDSTRWGKLLFERFKSGKLGVASTISNTTGDDAYHSTFDNNELYLKIVRYDTSYVFYTSVDSETWNFVRHFDLGTIEKPSVGFMAQSPLSEEFSATFSDVSFRSERISDFWQGE